MEILEHISEVPSHFQTQIRNHGGGYVNHIIYWAPLCPDLYSTLKPQGELEEDIEAAFGSMTEFLGRFLALSGQVFGSGYGWLVEDSEGNLILENTANQVSALILCIHTDCYAVASLRVRDNVVIIIIRYLFIYMYVGNGGHVRHKTCSMKFMSVFQSLNDIE